MDDFSSDLRHMAKTRVFALSAIAFFVFLTILVVILLSSQSKNVPIEQTDNNRRQQGSSSIFSLGKKPNVPIQVGSTDQQSNSGNSQSSTNSNGSASTKSGTQGGSASNQEIQSPVQKELARITKNALPLPKVQATSYNVKTNIPKLPEKINIYSFKTNYSDADVLAFSKKLGLSPVLIDRGEKTMTLTDRDGNVVTFDKTTGSFAYISVLGIQPENSSKNPAQTAANFLSEIGASDPTIIYTGTYTCPESPSSTCVEFHRNWQQVGFPILDILGLYNLAPGRSLKSLQLGEIDSRAPKDFRPNHFNTATVEVDNLTGRIKSVTSSIRRIAAVQSIPSSVLKSPEEVKADIENGRSVYSLAIPTGAGFVDLAKAFPSNLATAPNVIIDDIIPAYWENNPMTPQSELQLYYLACGTTTLDSGYGSRVCEVVPVIKGTINSVLGTSTKLAQSGPLDKPLPTQINTSKAESLQYGTFGFEGTTQESNCPQSFTNSYKVGPGQYIAWEHVPPPQHRRWYLVLTNEAQSEAIESTAVENLPLDQKARLYVMRNEAWKKCVPRLPNVCQGAPGGATIRGCYYILTGSPSIYLYPKSQTYVSVSANPKGGISYQNPAYNSENSWNVISLPNGDLTVSGQKVNNLYYEFNKSVLSSKLLSEKTGYIIRKEEIANTVRQISAQLKLNETETKNWVAEAERETKNMNAEYVRISLISPTSLTSHIPLKITPQPDIIHRFMLSISQANESDKLTAPSLSHLPRQGFTVVETGIIVR